MGLSMQIEWKTRLCKVGERFGYFHGWERYVNEVRDQHIVNGYL